MKPLKRFARFFLPLITGLKRGVNEMSISRTFEAKPCRAAHRPRRLDEPFDPLHRRNSCLRTRQLYCHPRKPTVSAAPFMKTAQAAIAIDHATNVSHRGTFFALCFTVLIDVARSTPAIDIFNLKMSVNT